MSNIYSFFGLPDPTDDDSGSGQSTPSEEVAKPEILVGERFHDMGEKKWRDWTSMNTGHPLRAIRYITPDHLYRMPIRDMTHRMMSGDVMVVDLRELKHMQAQQDACRRELSGMSERFGAPIFSLDDTETLLLIPGAGAVVDTTSHNLGIVDE